MPSLIKGLCSSGCLLNSFHFYELLRTVSVHCSKRNRELCKISNKIDRQFLEYINQKFDHQSLRNNGLRCSGSSNPMLWLMLYLSFGSGRTNSLVYIVFFFFETVYIVDCNNFYIAQQQLAKK